MFLFLKWGIWVKKDSQWKTKREINTLSSQRKYYFAWTFSLSKQNRLTTATMKSQASHLDYLKDYLFVYGRGVRFILFSIRCKSRTNDLFPEFGFHSSNLLTVRVAQNSSGVTWKMNYQFSYRRKITTLPNKQVGC